MFNFQKQSSRCVVSKRCSENLQQIYRRTSMPKCDFNNVAKPEPEKETLAQAFSCEFYEISKNHL